ncbi:MULTISPECIES: STM3941 family protein [unclassified Marinobacter]|uniref:STM3941 family protein n=1 Tax=unclassified Marinobacter TaxID=83889 RepID=UPI000BF392F8|nr:MULTISPECIES: STM3941 family protein [unclassified Marinobacter]PFG11432.1 hypothetical protein ATI45_3950 [Marinobacter sp. LV10MA510-1]PFG53260.1 hypothetical protein ATG98_2349 [Marinobacter sp. LV10R520-4]
MEIITAVCGCKELTEQNLVIAVKRERLGFLEEWGSFTWLGVIASLIVTGGTWIFFILGFHAGDILNPKYMCNQCRTTILPVQFRIPGYSNPKDVERETYVDEELPKTETSFDALPLYSKKSVALEPNETLDRKTIETSKVKILLLIIIAFGFVALGASFLSLDPAEIASRRRFNSPLLIHGIGVVSVGFFSLCAIAGIWKLFSSGPGLALSSKGIEIFGIRSNTLVPWIDVSGFSVYEMQSQKMLIVKLRNPKKYIEADSSFRRFMAETNYKMCGSPISVSANSLKISFKELCELFEQYFERYTENT